MAKGLIQRIAAFLYLHTNKREDVGSYQCMAPPHPYPSTPTAPLCACLFGLICKVYSFSFRKTCVNVRLEKPLILLRAI